MTPLPKRRVSSARRDRRRANDFLTPKNLTQCPNCGEMCLPHTVCPSCGYYKGREVINVEKPEKKEYALPGTDELIQTALESQKIAYAACL